MLIVTMPTTPGACVLSGAAQEAEELAKYSLRSRSIVDILERPTVERVFEVLPAYSVAHFACHGISSSNPADSHLMLLKGTGGVDMLRVKDIASPKLPALRLTYLSACNTANTTTLIDEATHTVSAFHIAGFINVIGHEGEACHKMATDFILCSVRQTT